MQPGFEHILQILASLAAGAILGLEREYHSKPAWFRTMILKSFKWEICIPSVLNITMKKHSEQ